MGLEVIANVYPAKDKIDIIRSELFKLADQVKNNEPGASRYQIYEQTNAEGGEAPQFVVVEEYDDQAAFDAHVSTDFFKTLGAKIEKEGLIAKPLDIKTVKKLAGFLSR